MQELKHRASHRARVATWLPAAILGVFFFLCHLTQGGPPAAGTLDASYSAVLGWALAHGYVWGREIVFTFGPLGYFPPNSPYLPGLYPAYMAAQFAVAAAIGATFAHLLANAGNLTRVLAVALAVVWLPWLSLPQADGIWFAYFAVSAVGLALQSQHSSRFALVGWAAFYIVVAASLSLTKFTFWPLSVVWLLTVAAVLWRNLGAMYGVAAPVGYAAVTAGWWLVCGQPLSALPAYVRTATQLVEGYGPAMEVAPLRVFDTVGLATLVAFGGFALWRLAKSARSRRWDRAAVFFLLGCVLYFLWRASYTRADEHMRHFLVGAPLVAMAAIALATDAARPARWLMALVVVLLPASLIPFFNQGADSRPVTASRWSESADLLASRVGLVLHPMRGREAGEAQWLEATRDAALPRTRELVGGDSIDMLGFRQGLMLSQGLNYRMRPVFQSYTVYTPELQRINGEYFDGPRAPQWLLLAVESLDGRLPMLDDADSQLAALRHYRPVLDEQGFVLLKRRSAASALPPPRVEWHETTFGQWVDVPANELAELARIEAWPNLAGKLRALALREPPLQIEIEDSQQSRSTYRFVRTQALRGFLLSPVITNTPDWLEWYTRSHARVVRRMRIVLAEPGQQRWFDPRIRVGFSALPDPRVAESEIPAGLDVATAAGFNVRPSSRQGDIRGTETDGNKVMFMHAPSWMRFSLPPGRYKVGTAFGVLREALTAPACSQANGVRLALYAASGAGRRPLATGDLNPFAPVNGPVSARLRNVVVALAPGEQLELDIEAVNGNTACDWGYVHDLHVDPVAPSSPLSAGAVDHASGAQGLDWTADTLSRAADPMPALGTAGQCTLDRLVADGRRTGVIAAGTTLDIAGWQIGPTGVPATRALLELAGGAGTFRQRVTLGLMRPDVAAALKNPRVANAGFSGLVPAGSLPPGRYQARLLLEANAAPVRCDLDASFEAR